MTSWSRSEHELKNDGTCGAIGTLVAGTIDNIGLCNQRMWAQPEATTSLSQTVASTDARGILVVDLSSCSREERPVVAAATLRAAWERQQKRRSASDVKPTILVVDEAHNLFRSRSTSQSDLMTLGWGSAIAGEGRKCGLYMIMASRLPSGVPPVGWTLGSMGVA